MTEEQPTIWKRLDIRCKSNCIIFRNSSNGLWLCTLLFLAHLQTILRNPLTIQLDYELVTVLLCGMMLQSLEIFASFTYSDQTQLLLKMVIRVLPAIFTSAIFNQIFEQDFVFSAFTGTFVLIAYYLLLTYILKAMRRCFTFGEATIVTQALVVFLYNCFLKLPSDVSSMHEQLNKILQLGLLGVLAIIASTHFVPILRQWFLFYPLLAAVVVLLCRVRPAGSETAASILWDFVFSDVERSLILGGGILLLAIAVYTLRHQIKKNQRGTTATRKIFHILTVLVYLPGLVFQCDFLYVASVVTLALLVVLELARVIKLIPVAEVLAASVTAFIDDQDAGEVVLTPLYLLAGCSLPLWIHNSPCDLTNSSGSELLPLLAGILSIGIGDTFASIVGSKIGRHKWSRNSQKSVEGTLASILAQGAFIYGLWTLQLLDLNTKLMALCGIAVISNALIEAYTSQVDNLVLPVVTYIILAYK